VLVSRPITAVNAYHQLIHNEELEINTDSDSELTLYLQTCCNNLSEQY